MGLGRERDREKRDIQEKEKNRDRYTEKGRHEGDRKSTIQRLSKRQSREIETHRLKSRKT